MNVPFPILLFCFDFYWNTPWVIAVAYERLFGRCHMLADAPYLRERAHQCVALARDCPHLPTSQALEALGVELMEKAAEIEKLTDDDAK